ncbi:hypothetical protein L9F63_011281, partial [Diploptera punctata]
MRLFKRRCSDPSPQLVSLSPISHDVISDPLSDASSRHHQRPPPAPTVGCKGASAPPGEANRKGLATWGKKLLAVTPGRRRHWSPNKTTLPAHPPAAARRRISRVESLRNLFASRNSKVDKETNTERDAEWVKEECKRGIQDLYQLNAMLMSDEHLMDYLQNTIGADTLKTLSCEDLLNNFRSRGKPDLCMFLNNLLLLRADESGYESDSTRAGSDSPRGSIKSATSLRRPVEETPLREEEEDDEEEEKGATTNETDEEKLNFSRKRNAIRRGMKTLRLTKDETGELGMYIERKDPRTSIYVVSHIEPGGLVHRDGRFQVGDELVKVNGKRLRGMTLQEARTTLKNSAREVDIVISRSANPEPPPPVTGMRKFSYQLDNVTPRRSVTSGTLPRRPKSLSLSLFTVTFHKGPGRKSLGFSVVGGQDSPKGNMGIFVKTVFQSGQAAEEGSLKEGDEILAVNGTPLQGMTHSEAITVFKNIKSGEVLLHVGRRDPQTRRASKSKSCDDLDKFAGD